MSTSKHFDKLVFGLVALMLVATLLFMYFASTTVSATGTVLGYENRLFDTSRVHTIDIVMDDWDSFIETCENEEYSVCTAVIDGEKFSNVALRAKGNTSLSNVSSMDSDRYSFKMEFDHYQDGNTYYGLDKLCLNNLIQDNTMMKDYLVYQMMAEFGVDSPLCSYVYITVNGEDWGLYLAVEGVEDSFLERNYGSDTGNLYKPDSMNFGGGRGNGRDFDMDKFNANDSDSQETGTEAFNPADIQSENFAPPDMPQNTELPEGENMQPPEMPSGSDMPQMGERPEMPSDGEMPDMSEKPDSGHFPGGGDFSNEGNFPGGGNKPDMGGFGGMGSDDIKLKYTDDDFDSYENIFDSAKTDITNADKTRLIQSLKNLTEYTDLENTLYMEEVLRYFVVHNFVCNGDSYTGSMIHNYYLHEDDGVLSMIPWDYNLAFGTFQGNDASGTVNTSIDSPVSDGSVDDRPMVGWIFSSEEYTAAYHELFSEFINTYFSEDQLTAKIAETAALISPYVEKDPTKFCTFEEFEQGVEAITSFVTLRAEAVSNQLAGDTTTVDTGTLNLSYMGTMNAGGMQNKGPGR